MDNSQWYAVAIAAIIASFLCFYMLKRFFGWLKIFVVFYFFKYLRYRRIYTRLRGATTWFCALLIVVFLAGNITYLYLNVNNRDELLRQTGILSTVNLIPLALGGHMNFLVNICGLSSRDNNQMHVWVARVAVAEALLHSILAVTTHVPDFQILATWAAIIAAVSMIAILISSISLLQRHVYETFVRLHQFLAALIVAGVWVHVPRRLNTVPTVYLLVASCVWLGLRLLRLAVILFRNIRNGSNRCRVIIWSIPDALQVHVKVARPWKYRPGQYLYLCAHGGWMQSHPFFISWWYRDTDGQDVVVFLIRRRKGFSDSLVRSSSGSFILGVVEGKDENRRLMLATDPGHPQGVELRAFVEGPYGQEVILGEFGTVLLFATGIGIAGLLPFVREFLQGFRNFEVKARRISLFWEVESEHHLQWLGNWMTDLLSEDMEKDVLDIHVFVTGQYITKGAKHGMQGQAGAHGRIQMAWRALDIADMRAQLSERRGRSLVLLCGRTLVVDQARKAVQEVIGRGNKDIRLMELPFRPT